MIIEKDDYVSSVRDDSDHFRYNSKRNSNPQSYQKNSSNFALPRNSNTTIPNYKRQHHFQPHFYTPQMSQPNNFQTNNFQPNSFQSNNFQANQMTQQSLRPNQQNSPFPNQTNNTTKGSDWTPMSGVSTINSANNKQRHNRLYNLENIDSEQDSYSDEPHVDFQTDEQRQNQT
ncbi:dr1-associated corepressor homolog [Ctenocephalides felis]|uniref:dr1-associated corepressor homolog n=1 Tax=Ctenocephalides felis TaxID=7515 RepID=UPI000E6E4B1F|nr:dr1-associated corepressor homolog [Ctenocephalides felis]XP_026469976.1 dr1-associated corepressor homolog [Ctenocephalides felis]